MTNSAWIKAKAKEIGWHLVGIAPAARQPEAAVLREWLARGCAGDMAYLARNVEKREDPRLLFPLARSIIVCGLSYHSRAASPENLAEPVGRVARYARGADYHRVLKDKLFLLLRLIQEEMSFPLAAKVCVDTAPILERLCGQHAGLGWIGKHGGLINPTYGSWFFLGEILLNVELEADEPLSNQCGTCARCLDACPTGALVAPHVLDARQCLSYLTIEYRGVLPESARAALNNRVFGCDACQDACPYNQAAAAPGLPEFLPREPLQQAELSRLAALSDADFRRLFHDSPIWRATRPGFLRNVMVAIGNSGDPAMLSLLENASNLADPLVQAHVAWAKAQIKIQSQDCRARDARSAAALARLPHV